MSRAAPLAGAPYGETTMDLNVWGVALIGLMFVLLLAELFIPSGGILGLLAVVSGMAGLVCLFRYDVTWGLSGTASMIVMLPSFGYFAFRLWPSTPLGRRIIGAPTEEELNKAREAEQTERKRVNELVGKEGVVLSALRPVGVVDIDGVRYDALSEAMFIQAGARVKIVHADSRQVKVREVV
jgi:membrane-bound ClpP family serine protease